MVPSESFCVSITLDWRINRRAEFLLVPRGSCSTTDELGTDCISTVSPAERSSYDDAADGGLEKQKEILNYNLKFCLKVLYCMNGKKSFFFILYLMGTHRRQSAILKSLPNSSPSSTVCGSR